MEICCSRTKYWGIQTDLEVESDMFPLQDESILNKRLFKKLEKKSKNKNSTRDPIRTYLQTQLNQILREM